MRSSRSSILVAAALSLGAFGGAAAQVFNDPAPATRFAPVGSPLKRTTQSASNGGRNRKGKTVKADQRRALKRRNRA